MERLKRFLKDEEGASLVEYGLLVGLIAVVCIAVVTTLGTGVRDTLQVADDSLPPAAAP
jgi:pilus assembly protein Flp/PilA